MQIFFYLFCLWALIYIEESIVRDNAIQSVKTITELPQTDGFEEEYAAMISRLATKEWFTARISACALIASSIERLSPDSQVRILPWNAFSTTFECWILCPDTISHRIKQLLHRKRKYSTLPIYVVMMFQW